jgi:hypothetical protein
MKLLIMQFSPLSCHFIPLRTKYSPQPSFTTHVHIFTVVLMAGKYFYFILMNLYRCPVGTRSWVTQSLVRRVEFPSGLDVCQWPVTLTCGERI